jgi:branched-chain amino acid transport system permease protein
MVAMRENEERSRMLGYNPFMVKLAALACSGLYAGAAGAAYALLFGYAGASFATIQYSILPMLYFFLVGAALVALVLFAPKGILGTIRERWVRWLP